MEDRVSVRDVCGIAPHEPCGAPIDRRTFGKLIVAALSTSAAFPRASLAAAASSESEPDAPDHLPRRRVKVLDTEISYVDVGQGDPVIFIHGNPTWSYQWRNIIPHISPLRRCLAPDLVGMGWSGKSPTKSYRFVDQSHYIDAWIDTLNLDGPITFVLHDWGGPIGFSWARRHPQRVAAIAYYEAIVIPRRWSDYSNGRDVQFRALRSPDGERLIMDENMFVEVALPRGILRKLSAEEMEAYRAPYRDRERRLPTLVWPRELPIDGVPEDVVAIVEENARWLATSNDVAKLFINGNPGSSSSERQRAFCRTLPNQREITVKGLHHLQEDSPDEIGEAVRALILRS